MYSRARQLKIAVSFYSPARGLRTVYCVREDFWSRVRRVESGHPVFRRGTVLSFWPYYVWEFGGFFCFTFFIVLLFCNLYKIL